MVFLSVDGRGLLSRKIRMILDGIDKRPIDHIQALVADERVGEVDLRLILLFLFQPLLLLLSRAQPFARIDAIVERLSSGNQSFVDC